MLRISPLPCVSASATPLYLVPHSLSVCSPTAYTLHLAPHSAAVSAAGATGRRFKESVRINTSLLVLADCIKRLSEGAEHQHIPFRDSKLTW
jgi:hypothetical protein